MTSSPDDIDYSTLPVAERLRILKRIVDSLVQGDPSTTGTGLFSWEELSQIFTRRR